jgi:hypothetical protein
MAKKPPGVPRPVKTTEHVLRFGTRSAETGWRDVVATQKNAAVDAWDRLTTEPRTSNPRCHQLRGELATIVRDGVEHDRWQYELTGGARIWYYVEERTVVVIDVFTAHPNQTK